MKAKFIVPIVALLLTACAGEAPVGEQESCTVVETEDSVTMECPDGTSATIAKVDTEATCTVEEVEGGAEVTCPDGSTVFVENGAQGEQGEAGETPDVTTQEEPAGENCEFGGFAILVDGEVIDYACNGRGLPECDVLHGGVVIADNDVDLARLTGCRIIEGDLTVSNVTSLDSLRSLREVRGTFQISGTHVESLAALNLFEAAHNVVVNQNDSLTDLANFSPVLAYENDNGDDVHGLIIFQNNDMLSSCDVDDFCSTLYDPSWLAQGVCQNTQNADCN